MKRIALAGVRRARLALAGTRRATIALAGTVQGFASAVPIPWMLDFSNEDYSGNMALF